MAGTAPLSREERLGLGVAVAAHLALAALFLVQDDTPTSFEVPERMVVSLADEVSLESTAPDPSAQPAASVAPELAAEPSPPVPEPVERVIPQEVEPAPPPPPPPRPRASARPTPRPSPSPTPRASASPRPAPSPAPSPAPRASASPRPTPAPTATPTRQRAGGSHVGADFLEGRSDTEGRSGSPATTFGATEQAALASAITRQLKPHWSAPSGVDVDHLVTVLTWELNADGSLKGNPRLVSQTGVNDSNRPQAARHAEQAIRAVQLAAPFNLPDQFYDRWKRVREFRFDRRL